MAKGLQILSAENGMIWLNNVPVAAAIGIDIEESVATEEIHVIGQAEPVAVVNTKRTFKGTLTLLRTQADALQRGLPKGKSFTQAEGAMLQFSYLSEGNILMTDQVNNLKFTGVKKSIKGGEAFKEITLEFIATGIEYNIGQ